MITLKLTHKTKEELEKQFLEILDTLSIMVRGRVPSPTEIERMNLNHGLVEFRDGSTYDLLPTANNHWVFLDKRSDTELIFRIRNRYDTNDSLAQAMGTVIATRNMNVELLLEGVQTN